MLMTTFENCAIYDGPQTMKYPEPSVCEPCGLRWGLSQRLLPVGLSRTLQVPFHFKP